MAKYNIIYMLVEVDIYIKNIWGLGKKLWCEMHQNLKAVFAEQPKFHKRRFGAVTSELSFDLVKLHWMGQTVGREDDGESYMAIVAFDALING